MSDAPKAKRLTGEQRRESFLDAAAELIRDSGLESVTMERVAARCDVNKALPYRYFKNREDLLLAVFQRDIDRFDARIGAAMAAADGFEGQVRAVLDTWLDSVDDSSLLITQFEQSRPGGDAFEVMRRQREEQTLAFIAGVFREHHDLTPKEALTAAAVLGAGSQGVVGLLQNTAMRRSFLVDRYVTMCRGALEALVAARQR